MPRTAKSSRKISNFPERNYLHSRDKYKVPFLYRPFFFLMKCPDDKETKILSIKNRKTTIITCINVTRNPYEMQEENNKTSLRISKKI
jgi:hypothetical protein